jgi:hypothetical protein
VSREIGRFYIPEDANRSGIEVTYIPRLGILRIGGWYDSMVGLDGGEFRLHELFQLLGITEQDAKKAFAALRKQEAEGGGR